jgi:putative ABC transport system substrate-binding protein
MLLFSEGFVVAHRDYIVNFAMSRRTPIASGWAVMVEAGALCRYGSRLIEAYRRVAYLVDRILKGTKPADFADTVLRRCAMLWQGSARSC